ncbi:MAG: hypothetical protein GTN80_00380 [Nitrososphaeria archaeon]|nr:hypothetical protein [Nitrososphaeria archaeon]NIN51616.1 hypothetical protein [Nitrososphaeria archaeon]NIQ32101.1 hypothetical protein [Nitrososphaeria archaeon]
MKIESYDFGRITIGGESYTNDLIIYPEKVDDSWWRREGHRLNVEDLKEIILHEPEVLIVGTGYYERMRVQPETEKYLRLKGITLIVKGTREACETYNQLIRSKRVVAALHLTC